MTDESAELSDEKHKDSDPQHDFRSSFSSAEPSDKQTSSDSSAFSDTVVKLKKRLLNQTDFGKELVESNGKDFTQSTQSQDHSKLKI